MAAGQQKKRLISSSLHEHYRGKKKKRLETSDHVVNLRSQIYLEWDDNKKKAVAKREQIGITWKGMVPFVDSVPQCPSGLADVLCVPREIYSLNNLMDVLSYQVWATCLSESERELLAQFLPSGTGEQAIQLLLSGENFHFINPFIRWSSSLCSGTLHPDDVLQREQQIKSIKKEYYSELNKYHTNMLEGLKKMKDQWSRCNDPEKLWRQDLVKPKERSSPLSTKRTKEVSPKVSFRNDDVAKYMSYIKVSKKQHDAIKNLKCSGDGVLFNSLSHVLGDTNAFDVHPYEALEREEKLRLQKHWLQVVNKDLPVAFGARKEIKLQREQLRKYLEQELFEKQTMIRDKTERDHAEISPQDNIEGRESKHGPADVLVQEDVSVSVNPEHSHRMERIPSLNSHPELCPVALNKDVLGQVIPILGDNSPVISRFNGANIMDGLMEAKAKEIWQNADGPQYNSSSDFSLLKPEPIEEHQGPIIDLERDHDVGEPGDASLFSLYASQRINDHFTSFTKGPETLSSYSHHAHMNHLKQPDLQFLMSNGSLSDTVQYPRRFQHQQNLIAHSNNARENKNVFSNGIYPNQELYSPANGDLLERAPSNYWPGVEPSTSNSDGSLFSVLSGCRNMQPKSLNNTTNSDHLIEARNFGTGNDRVYGYVPQQFKSSNSHETTVVSSTGLHVPWMNYHLQQNSNMQDSMGKPFLRSWNQ